MSTQVFFQSPMGPLHGSRVKITGHIFAHRTPLSPRTIATRHVLQTENIPKRVCHPAVGAYNAPLDGGPPIAAAISCMQPPAILIFSHIASHKMH